MSISPSCSLALQTKRQPQNESLRGRRLTRTTKTRCSLPSTAFAFPLEYLYLILSWIPSSLLDASQGGFYLVSGSRDRSLRVWCVATCKCILVLERAHDNWVRDITIHPSGKFLLSCSDDNSIRVWNIVNKGTLEKKIDAAHDLFVSSLHFCPR